MEKVNPDGRILTRLIPRFRDINVGIVLISLYLLFEIGSVQGMYSIINDLRLPFILATIFVLYSLYLLFSSKVDFSSPVTKSYFVFCLFVILYALITTKYSLAREDVIKVFLGFLCHYIVLIGSVKKTSQLLLVVNIWLFSILLSSFHASQQGGLVWGSRWLKDENHISLLVAIAIPFVFLLFFIHRNKLIKLFYLLCMSLYITANVVAASRGGVLGMIIGGILCWLLEKNKLRNLMVVIVAAILVFSYAPPRLFDEIESLNQGTKESTADDRIYLWGVGIKMFNDSPVFGVGLMNYPYYFADYEKQVRYKATTARVPHSTPIQWLSETGLVGVFIMLILQRNLFMNWFFAHKNRYILIQTDDHGRLLYTLSQAVGISQVVFWFCACFLSLLPYPFYWFLIPLSESSHMLLRDYIQRSDDKTKQQAK